MKSSSFFSFDECKLSNDLWPDFINKIGYFCKTRKDVKLFNPYKKLSAVFDLNKRYLLH